MSEYSHMNLTDRCIIESCITNAYNLNETAERINRHPSTVTRELKNHRTFIKSKSRQCSHVKDCKERLLCSENGYCVCLCKNCRHTCCTDLCEKFDTRKCRKLERFPYVCNSCQSRDLCNFEQAYYHANKADKIYREGLSESRKGVQADDERIDKINGLITPLIKKGQSLNHIFATHSEELNCSRKTIYNYIERNILDVKNIDLPRKVRYKRRKKKQSEPVSYQYRIGRTYEDFKRHIAANPNVGVVEMDTVKGRRDKGKVMLTMVFVKYDFMLIFLLPENTQKCVTEVFRCLVKELGVVEFQRLFPVILTDNGPEFKNPVALESTESGDSLTRIFYCDPNAPYQKPHIERQHEILRRIIPKGKSLDDYTQEDMTLICNNINSFSRNSLGGKCPFDVARVFIGGLLPKILGFNRIQPDYIVINPSVLTK